MKSKLTYFIIVSIILTGFLIFINKNRSAREKIRIEEKIAEDRKTADKDSISAVNINTKKSKYGKLAKNITKLNSSETSNKKEDFDSYINTSISKKSNVTNIAVTILDPDGNISTSISSSLADIYTKAGLKGTNGLLRNSFVHKSSFQELLEGNSEIMTKLKLSNHTDYVALGKIQFSIKKGTMVSGTFVCTASLSMSIISASEKAISKSFSINATGNGANESQAQEEAIQTLLNKYSNDYSNL